MKSRLPLPLLLLGPLVVLAACESEPAAPTGCDVDGACAIEGHDLAIVDLDIDFKSSQPYRSEVDAHVVEPGDTLELAIAVFNRGTTTAPRARLVVVSGIEDTFAIPALDPGELFRRSIEIPARAVPFMVEMLDHIAVHIAPDTMDNWIDASWQNDSKASPHYHLLVPVLSADVDLPDTVRALVPYNVTVRITNRSPFVMLEEGLPWGFCFYDDGYNCDQVAGEITSMLPVTAGETRTTVGRLVVPHFSIPLDWPADGGGVWACIAPPLAEFGDFWVACLGGGGVAVRPNVQASCDPRLLSLPDAFDPFVRSPDCHHEGDHYWAAVVALDAIASASYRIAGDPGLNYDIRIVDLNGQIYPIVGGIFTAPRDARFYLLARGWDGTGGLIHVREAG